MIAALAAALAAPAPVAIPAMEGAPVAQTARVDRVRVAQWPGFLPACFALRGKVTVSYDGARYSLIDTAAMPRWVCLDNGPELHGDPVEVRTVWTGNPSLDPPMTVEVDLAADLPSGVRRLAAGSLEFHKYPIASDDCMTMGRTLKDVATIEVNVQFCGN